MFVLVVATTLVGVVAVRDLVVVEDHGLAGGEYERADWLQCNISSTTGTIRHSRGLAMVLALISVVSNVLFRFSQDTITL